MNNIKSTCPPLTPDDIFALRGQPVAKKIGPFRSSPARFVEEWVYYHIQTNSKEHYIFKNGRLTSWAKESV